MPRSDAPRSGRFLFPEKLLDEPEKSRQVLGPGVDVRGQANAFALQHPDLAPVALLPERRQVVALLEADGNQPAEHAIVVGCQQFGVWAVARQRAGLASELMDARVNALRA